MKNNILFSVGSFFCAVFLFSKNGSSQTRYTLSRSSKQAEKNTEFYFYFSKEDPAYEEGHARVACISGKAFYYLDAHEVGAYKDEEEARASYIHHLQTNIKRNSDDNDDISMFYLGKGLKAIEKNGLWYCPIKPESVQ